MDNRGNITVFTALIISTMILLIGALVEITRITSAKTRTRDIAYLSADSCLAHYGNELFEDYGIFGLWKKGDKIEELFKKYIKKTDNNTKDLLGISMSKCKIGDIKYLTDNNGEPVAKQIDEIMKYKISEDILKEILNEIKGINGYKKIKVIIDKIEKISDFVMNIEESIQQVNISLETIKGNMTGIRECISEMNKGIADIKSFKGKKNELLSMKAVYEENFDWLYKKVNEIDSEIERISVYINQFESSSQAAKPTVGEISDILNNNKEQLDNNLISSLKEQIDDLNAKIGNREIDYYNMYNCIDVLRQMKVQITACKIDLNNIDQYISDDDFSRIGEVRDDIPNVENLVINYRVEEVESSNKSIVKTMKKLFSRGISGLVIDEKISTKKIDVSEVPSRSINFDTHFKYSDYSSSNDYIRKVLCSQYILDYFSSYPDKREGQLEYEIEYILGGKSEDEENLNNVVNKLVAVREGFNLGYLITNSQKCNEAEIMAAALVGYTGVTPLITVTKFLILGVWATAESIVDVKMLMKGEKVALVKTDSTWNVSLDSLSSFYKKKYKNKATRFGIDYKGYLRILLLSQNSVQQVYRIMDIIEVNIQNKYSKSFSIKDCVYSLCIWSEYEIKRLFAIPGINKLYRYSEEARISY